MKSRLGYILAGLLILLLYFLPNFILGENSVIQVHDFLDSNVAHIQSMMLHHSLWDMDARLPILGGVDRAVCGTPYNLRVVLFWLLPTYWAIIANLLLIKLTAFLGLFFLLTEFVLKDGSRKALVAAFTASILFALVPFYPDYGISSAGIPMLLLAFGYVQQRRHLLLGMALIVYYAVFSALVLSGVFACVLLAFLILFHWIREKRFPSAPFWALAFLTILYVGLNWDLFAAFLGGGNGEVSHRVEFASSSLTAESAGSLLVSQYHAGLCLAILPVALFLAQYRRRYPSLLKLTLLVLGLMLAGILLRLVPFLNSFQTDRFYFLYPALAYLLLGAVLYEASFRWVKGALVAVLLLFSFAFDAHWRDNLATHLGLVEGPTFAQYYDTALISRIREAVPLEKVACVGMHPAIAEYNGIETVDGYYPSYPLSYKHRFQQVIQGELDKSAELKAYFCDWGSRCYLFSAELGTRYLWGKDCGRAIQNLDIDVDALRALGCGHILSAVPIENAEALGLRCCGSFADEGSFWEIRAYGL